MKRSITEILRRGFENVVANWPLLLIRIAEQVLFIVIVVVAIIAIIVPMVVSIGLNQFDPRGSDNPYEMMMSLLARHWLILVYMIGVITLVVTVVIAIHSFVEAGSARVYIDAEGVAQNVALPSRQQLRVFSVDRWLAGGRRWWSVFWIYNIAWGVASLILLVPLLLVVLVMLLLSDNPGAMAVTGCIGLAITFLFFLVVAVVTNVWSQKAIVVCVARTLGAAASLGAAWREFKRDAGRHIAVAIILFVLIMAGTMFFSSISAFRGLDDSLAFQLTTLPLQLVSSLLNTVFSVAMTSWFLASFAALTMESRPR